MFKAGIETGIKMPKNTVLHIGIFRHNDPKDLYNLLLKA